MSKAVERARRVMGLYGENSAAYIALSDLLAEIDAGVWPDAREVGPDGDVIVIGPECFASADELVISWKGVNYYAPMDGAVSAAREAADA